MKKTFNGKLFAYLLAAILLPACLLLIANSDLFDESLDKEMQFLQQQPSPVELENNGYFTLFGFDTINPQEMNKTGQALYRRYQHNRDDKGEDHLSDQDYQQLQESSPTVRYWNNKMKHCQPFKKSDCASRFLANFRQLRANKDQLEDLSARNHLLLHSSVYQDPGDITFATPLPAYGSAMKYLNAEMAAVVDSGDTKAFINLLSQHVRLWNQLYASSDLLLAKMIAVAGLHWDLQFTSQLVNQSSISENELQAISNIIATITLAPEQVEDAMRNESRALYRVLKKGVKGDAAYALDVSNSSLYLLSQPNATINLYHHQFLKPLRQLARLPADEYRSRLIKITETGEDPISGLKLNVSKENIRWSPSFLYNPIGKILLSALIYDATGYISRVHDLNAKVQLTLLGLSLSNVAESQIAPTIQQSAYRNPLDGLAFKYQAGNKRIYFDCLVEGASCQIALR